MFNQTLFDTMIGPVLPAGQERALGGSSAQWQASFDTYLPIRMTADVGWAAENYYDRARILYSEYAATGVQAYLDEANAIVVDFRDNFLSPNNGQIAAHWAMMQGVALHYAVTGDTRDLAVIGQVADYFALPWYTAAISNTASTDGDNRIQAYALRSFLVAEQTGAPSEAGNSWSDLLHQTLDAILATQSSDGIWHWAGQNNLVKPFMVGVLNDVLIQYYTQFDADPRILASVRASVDYLWAHDWDAASQSFFYLEGATESEPDGRTPAPDLNNLISLSAAWIYHQTGDIHYQQMAEAIFAGGVTGSWLGGGKQFNQEYAQTFNEQYYQHATPLGTYFHIAVGNAGNDVLTGTPAIDILNGGPGNDTVTYADSSAGVAVNLATGTGQGGYAPGDVLMNIENVIGSAFADMLTGDAGSNGLAGQDGNDIITGGAGNDGLAGGAGSDTFRFFAGDGADTISDFTPAAGGDVLNFVGINAASVHVTGQRIAGGEDFRGLYLGPSNATVFAQGDFDSNGQMEVIWRAADATTTEWSLDARGAYASTSLGSIGLSWQVVGTDHLRANGTSEMVGRGSDGTMAVWWVSNGALAGINLGRCLANAQVMATGDFSSHGQADILVRNTADNHMYNWWIDQNNALQGMDLGACWGGVNLVATANFYGDNHTDMLIRNTSDNHMYVWSVASNNTLQGIDLGACWGGIEFVAAGNFLSSGAPEFLVRNAADNHMYVWWVGPNATLQGIDLGACVGSNIRFLAHGNFDGTGGEEMLVRNTADNHVYMWWVDAQNRLAGRDLGAFGANWNVVQTGDYNHDGTTDILWQNAADGRTAQWSMGGYGYTGADQAGLITSSTTVITYGSGDSITLTGVSISSVDPTRFTYSHAPTPLEQAPVVGGSNISAAPNSRIAASSLFIVSDADHDAILAYQFADANAGATSGHFELHGSARPSNQIIDVAASELDDATFVVGSVPGTDTLQVRAFDGLLWSDWHVLTI